MIRVTISMLATLCLVAACGGSGSDTTPAPAPTPDPVSPLTRAQQLNTLYGQSGATAMAAMPTTGKANYKGAAVFGKSTDMDALLKAPAMAADMALSTDFATGKVTGGLDNFRDSRNKVMDGKVTLSGGQIAGNAVGGDLAGSVAGTGVSAQMAGTFKGTGAKALSGVIADSKGTAGSFNGAFVTAR